MDPTTARFNTTAISKDKSPPQQIYLPRSPPPRSGIVVAEHTEQYPPADVTTTAGAFIEGTGLSQPEAAVEPLPLLAKQQDAPPLASVDEQKAPSPGLSVEGKIERVQDVERRQAPGVSATSAGAKAQKGKATPEQLAHVMGESSSEQAMQETEAEVASEPPQPLPPGALLAPEAREATRAWATALARSPEADSGKETSSSGSKSGFDIGWGKGWGIRGDFMEGDNTEELLGTGWDSRRGFVGERFIRAAEVRITDEEPRHIVFI